MDNLLDDDYEPSIDFDEEYMMAAKAKGIVEEFETENQHLMGNVFRGPATRGEGNALPPFAGKRLIELLGSKHASDFEVLLIFEKVMLASDWDRTPDLAILVSQACCHLVEPAINRLLITPATSVADAIHEAVHARKKRSEGLLGELERWASGKCFPTLGTQVGVLYGLRSACKAESDTVMSFLRDNFSPTFADFAASTGLMQCLDKIRQNRNAAVHVKTGEDHEDTSTGVDLAAYNQFVDLVVGHPRFNDWNRHGHEAGSPPPQRGVLHHHLRQHQRARHFEDRPANDNLRSVAKACPIERFLNLRTPHESTIRLSLRALPFKGSGTSSGEASRSAPISHFRCNEKMRFQLDIDRSADVLLVSVDANQNAARLFPNRWQESSHLESGCHLIPASHDNYAFSSATPGRESVVAIASSAGGLTGIARVDGSEKEGFRHLSENELATLAEWLESRPPGEWSAARIDFEISGQGL